MENIFKWNYFEAKIIILCIRWYLKYNFSNRGLQEIMIERCIEVMHMIRKGQVEGIQCVLSEVRVINDLLGILA
jgi:transposase-like protein